MKTRERFKTLRGDYIEFEQPDPEVRAFLSRVIDLANDPNATESNLVNLIYGNENPILDQEALPTRGLVTKEAYENPVYHVMLDLLDLKRIQEGTVRAEDADAYSVTVTEAAKLLDVHVSAVRQAVQNKRIPAIKKGSRWMMRPEDVDAFEVERRGPQPSNPLQVRLGHKSGAVFKVKHPGELQGKEQMGTHVYEGTISRFKRVGVLSGPTMKHRFFVLEPSSDDNELNVDEFFIRGSFAVVEKVNNSREAEKAYKQFNAE